MLSNAYASSSDEELPEELPSFSSPAAKAEHCLDSLPVETNFW